MTETNYVHITFTMRPETPDDGYYAVSERWPLTWEPDRWTVSDSGDIPVGEGDYDFEYREVIAFAWLDSDALASFRAAWCLDPEDSEPNLGFLADLGFGPRRYADERHSADGMDWNEGGWSPVMFADVSIVGPDARP